MNRDQAMHMAIKQARDARRIRVFFWIEGRGWEVYGYPDPILQWAEVDPSSIRYVLPNGEVTKLS